MPLRKILSLVIKRSTILDSSAKSLHCCAANDWKRYISIFYNVNHCFLCSLALDTSGQLAPKLWKCLSVRSPWQRVSGLRGHEWSTTRCCAEQLIVCFLKRGQWVSAIIHFLWKGYHTPLKSPVPPSSPQRSSSGRFLYNLYLHLMWTTNAWHLESGSCW